MPHDQSSPRVIVLAGPNGAGKTSSSRTLLAETLGVMAFVNADVIAQGLSGFAPESVAWEASRIMLERLHALAKGREDFALETTLAARSYSSWLAELKGSGYQVHLYYFWLDSPDLAVARVAERVRAGGHSIPGATIRSRYRASLSNLFELYLPLADTWAVYNNSQLGSPMLIAQSHQQSLEVVCSDEWNQMQHEAQHG